MKRIACLNTMLTSSDDPKASEQLVDIFNSTRIYNKEKKVQGVVLVAKNVLFQIIEGESSSLAESIYRLNRDARIKDVSVILNSEIDEPFFKSWRIKFIHSQSEKNDQYLNKLQSAISKQLKITTALDSERLSLFFSPNRIIQESPSREKGKVNVKIADNSTDKYLNHQLLLTAWPKPSQFKPTAELLKICSLLSQRETLYQDLLAKNICASKESLDNYLGSLDSFGLLVSKLHIDDNPREKKSPLKPRLVSVSSPIPATKDRGSSDRFSQVLRKFITSAKRIR